MAEFETESMARYESTLLAHLRTVFAEQTQKATDSELLDFVRPSINRARAYGIVLEYDVTRFVDLTFYLGNGFDTSTDVHWANPIVTDESLQGWQKADRLWNCFKTQMNNCHVVST